MAVSELREFFEWFEDTATPGDPFCKACGGYKPEHRDLPLEAMPFDGPCWAMLAWNTLDHLLDHLTERVIVEIETTMAFKAGRVKR